MRVEVDGRGLDIGRDQHLDWTLPDPSRFISGKHCEVRYREGAYYLHDVSSNGTYLNGAQFRMESPHRLRQGDRLQIGDYIVAVDLEGEAEQPASSAVPSPAYPAGDPWSGGEDAAPPADRRDFSAASRQQRAAPDFPDWALQIVPPAASPPSAGPPPFEAPPAPVDAQEWFAPPRPLPADPPPPPRPEPRRPAPRQEAVWSEPAEAPEPLPPRPSANGAGAGEDEAVLRRIAAAAGLPETALLEGDRERTAEVIGAVLRQTARHLAQMLATRAETKSAMRSASRTMIRAVDNNPLKFAPSPEEALRIMFGPRSAGYLDAQGAVEQSFSDLKAHQVQTFSAMQAALEALFEDLAPDRIDATVPAERGLGAVVGSRKARLWDVYVERWRAKTARSDGRLVDAFTRLFAESYDRLQGKDVR